MLPLDYKTPGARCARPGTFGEGRSTEGHPRRPTGPNRPSGALPRPPHGFGLVAEDVLEVLDVPGADPADHKYLERRWEPASRREDKGRGRDEMSPVTEDLWGEALAGRDRCRHCAYLICP